MVGSSGSEGNGRRTRVRARLFPSRKGPPTWNSRAPKTKGSGENRGSDSIRVNQNCTEVKDLARPARGGFSWVGQDAATLSARCDIPQCRCEPGRAKPGRPVCPSHLRHARCRAGVAWQRAPKDVADASPRAGWHRAKRMGQTAAVQADSRFAGAQPTSRERSDGRFWEPAEPDERRRASVSERVSAPRTKPDRQDRRMR